MDTIIKLGVIGSQDSDIITTAYSNTKACNISVLLEKYIKDYKYVTCVTPLNPGIDFLFAWAAILTEVKLLVIEPFTNYELTLDNLNKNLYEELKGYKHAEFIVFTKGFSVGWQKENRCRHVIDVSNLVLIFKGAEDFNSLIKYAEEKKKEFIIV